MKNDQEKGVRDAQENQEKRGGPQGGPGESGPGEPGYEGEVNVGDDAGVIGDAQRDRPGRPEEERPKR